MKIKGFIISGIILSLIGGGLCAFAATRDDFSTENIFVDPNLEEKTTEFRGITHIKYEGSADYVIIKKTSESSSITYQEGKKLKYNIQIDEANHSLSIEQEYEDHFLNLGFLSKGNRPLTIYLNESITDLDFDLKAGKLTLEDISCTNASLSLNAGDIEAKGFLVDNLRAEINAGDFRFEGSLNYKATIKINAGYLKMELPLERDAYLINEAGSDKIMISVDIDAGSYELKYKE